MPSWNRYAVVPKKVKEIATWPVQRAIEALASAHKDAACRAWINFNGTGVIAIRDSFNVSGIVDNGVGDYTITWDRDFANGNYSVVALSQSNGLVYDGCVIKDGVAPAAGSVRVFNCKVIDGTGRDPLILCVQAFGDQA